MEIQERDKVEERFLCIVAFLADNAHHNAEEAEKKDYAWYREQVGPDVCTITQAIRIRRATIDECHLHAMMNAVPADQQLDREGDCPGFWLLLCLPFIFTGMVLVFGATGAVKCAKQFFHWLVNLN